MKKFGPRQEWSILILLLWNYVLFEWTILWDILVSLYAEFTHYSIETIYQYIKALNLYSTPIK